jgi:hypothetical protein
MIIDGIQISLQGNPFKSFFSLKVDDKMQFPAGIVYVKIAQGKVTLVVEFHDGFHFFNDVFMVELKAKIRKAHEDFFNFTDLLKTKHNKHA